MLTISTTELPNATKGRPSLRRMVAKIALPGCTPRAKIISKFSTIF